MPVSVAIFIHGIQWIGYTLHFGLVNHLSGAGLGGGINTVTAGAANRDDVPVTLLP